MGAGEDAFGWAVCDAARLTLGDWIATGHTVTITGPTGSGKMTCEQVGCFVLLWDCGHSLQNGERRTYIRPAGTPIVALRYET